MSNSSINFLNSLLSNKPQKIINHIRQSLQSVALQKINKLERTEAKSILRKNVK